MSDETKDTYKDLEPVETPPADNDIADEDGTLVPPDTQVKGRKAVSSSATKGEEPTAPQADQTITADDDGDTAEEQTEEQKTEKSRKRKKEENFGEALKEAIHEQAREDEPTLTSNITLRKILGGDFLTASMIRRQIGMILIIVAFTIVYISNRYSCQRNLLEIDRLNSQLQDAKYKALSSSSMLTEKCRESHVLDMLKQNHDSLLHIADQPPYIIYVPQN